MRMLRGQLLIFLIIHSSESSGVIDALYDAGEEVWKFYSVLDKSFLPCSSNARTVRELFSNNYEMDEKIRDQMHRIHDKIVGIENSMNFQIINNLMKMLRPIAIAFKCVDTMEIFIKNINDAYEIFYRTIIQDGSTYDRLLNKLIASVFPDIESNIVMIRKIMTNPQELFPGETSVIGGINNYVETRYKEICNIYQSIDEILVYLFKRAILAELKTSLMSSLASLYNCRQNQEWQNMNNLTKTKFREYFQSYVIIMQQTLKQTTGLYMRACDPTAGAWILNENYYAFDGISQAMIFRYQQMECPFESCRNKWMRRATQCDASYYDTRSGCSNTPTACEDLGIVQACVLKSGLRRFQYVNSSIFGFYGSNPNCPKDDGYILDNLSEKYAGYATCGCHCKRSYYKISLVIMESAVISNEVITGLRLQRRNNILHIQPRVGVLMANCYIQRNSESWLQIPNDINASQIHYVDKENSLFFLDDILLPPKFVLTGVKFNKVTRGTITGFAIEIFGVRFDYRSGQLYYAERIQLSSSRNYSGRPLSFYPISSLQTKKRNLPSSPELKYVQLEQSTLRNDFGQSMLPLFDAVPVTTDPPSPLSGMGIFHKGGSGYAGLISFRAYGIRYQEDFENFTSAHTIQDRMQLFT